MFPKTVTIMKMNDGGVLHMWSTPATLQYCGPKLEFVVI